MARLFNGTGGGKKGLQVKIFSKDVPGLWNGGADARSPHSDGKVDSRDVLIARKGSNMWQDGSLSRRVLGQAKHICSVVVCLDKISGGIVYVFGGPDVRGKEG